MSNLSMDEMHCNGEHAKVLFCRKCGQRLQPNSGQCSACGTIVACDCETSSFELKEDNQVCDEGQFQKKKSKRLGKTLLICFVSLILVAGVALGGLYFWNTRVIKQDINSINGCPEFYNIEFGMTLDEASSLIQLKHKAYKGMEGSSLFPVDEAMKDSQIIIDEEEVFYLYGKKTSKVYVGFDGKYLESVIFKFSQDDYKLQDIVSLYEEIYGEPTKTETIYSSWCGPKTTIDVFEYVSDDGEPVIVVRYIITE